DAMRKRIFRAPRKSWRRRMDGGDRTNDARLQALLGQMLNDLGGAFSISMVRMGTALGLYKTMLAGGPMTSAALAAKAKLEERYVREWLAHHAASNYVTYDPQRQTFALRPEQAAILADEDSPVYLADAFEAAAGYVANQEKVQAA